MNTEHRQKIITSAAGVVMAVLLLFSSGVTLPVLDAETDAFFETAITRAGLAYATCRTINASVSIVKESSIQLEPAGVGLSLANAFLEDQFFADRIGEARKELALGFAELDKLNELSLPPIDGIVGTIENSAAFLKRKSIEFKHAVVYAVSNMGSIIENLLTLTFLYVGIFLIQVVILPLLCFWGMARMANAMFDAKIPVVVGRAPSSGKGTEQSFDSAGG